MHRQKPNSHFAVEFVDRNNRLLSVYSRMNELTNFPADTDVAATYNMSNLIFAHLHINSLRNKIVIFSEQIKTSIDILMISETKLDDSIPDDQFLVEGYHASFRFDRNKCGGGIIL